MKRASGVFLHITSLPSNFGVGDFGPSAYKFADFLNETRQSFWQILPLTQSDPVGGNSPYFCLSSFAGNKMLISPEIMQSDGLLGNHDLENVPAFPKNVVDYRGVLAYKENLLARAYDSFKGFSNKEDFHRFCSENSSWLDDYSLFAAVRKNFNGKVWSEWPSGMRDRMPDEIQKLKRYLGEKIEFEKFVQYIFFKQWFALKRYCNERGIQVIGDLPIYVNHDSADTWSNPNIFKLDERKNPLFVGGVPPDYFSSTGQLWGNPVYNWDEIRKTGYEWWVRRMGFMFKTFDLVRIDHFRGLVAFWEVPASEKTAINGKWVKAPAEDLFKTLFSHYHKLPVIAEDLGTITPDVTEVIHRFGFPGMKVLSFAFGSDFPRCIYLIHNHVKNSVVYTTTHDTNTARGWFEREATQEERKRVLRYIRWEVQSKDIHLEFMRMAMSSVADLAIIPMQDVLGLGEEARMNRPATTEGNWVWRLMPGQITHSTAQTLAEMTEVYERAKY